MFLSVVQKHNLQREKKSIVYPIILKLFFD